MDDDWKINPMDELAYHGPAGDYVKAVQAQTEADPIGILVQILVMFGNVMGRTFRYMVGATEHFANLFIVVIGTTGRGRKGTSYDLARLPFQSIDPNWTRLCFAAGLSSGEGLVSRVRDPVMKPGSDELLDEGITDKRLLVAAKEFSSPLKMMNREGNVLSEQVRLAWEVGNLGLLTKNKRETATGAHISIIGQITPSALQLHFDTEHIANGLGNRFLFFYVRGTQLLPGGGDESVIRAASAEFAEAGRAALRQLKPGTMSWTPDAREIWNESYLTTLNIERPGMFGQLISRGAPQVARMALIYAALDSSLTVEISHVLAALSVWDFSVRTTRMAFGDKIGIGDADAILAALRAQPEGMSRKSILDFFSRNITSSRIEAALLILQKEQLAAFQMIKADKGRPAEVWRAVPKPPAPTPDYLEPFRTKDWQKKLSRANAAMARLRTKAKAGDITERKESANGQAQISD